PRPAEHAGGEIHGRCDISAEPPMPLHPNTPFDDLEPTAVLTAVEVADRIRVDARSVRRAVARGDLTASRACGLRILASDAAEWWRSRTVLAPTPPPAAASAPFDGPPERTRRAAARRRPEASARLPLPPRRGDGP
ncbi:MAG: helix-turn-helix domain-containing protein, partial [Solirubrobacteraceae bacterium]|nr:helix-turn-helix domain-containing protein [Solirubrobacteraceae bacterium]